MKAIVFTVVTITALLSLSCSNEDEVLIPQFPSGGFLSQTYPLPEDVKSRMDGIYAVDVGAGQFGPNVVMRWTGNYLSVFTGKNVGYFVLQGGYLDSVVFLEGYWRYQINTETGLARLIVPRDEGGRYLLGDVTGGAASIRVRGDFGNGDASPDKGVVFRYLRPIKQELRDRNFLIIGHRGGGRTSDDMPASENTVEIVSIAERYGCTAVEIDVRLTKDGVPILYHDNGLNLRETQKGPLVGDVEEYTFAQLRTLVRLVRGERIPTLEEALDAIVTKTNLRFVYLDTKTEGKGIVAKIVPIQQAALAKSRTIGRKDSVEICIGIPSDEVLQECLAYPGFQNIPSLCELTTADVRAVNARVWAPRWTLGTQNAEVDAMHAEGRRAVPWTLDGVQFIEQYLREGKFDGILTNYPMAVAYAYYMQ